jgi:hypothetical protein
MNPQSGQRCRRVRTYSGARGAGAAQNQHAGSVLTGAGAAVDVRVLTTEPTDPGSMAFHGADADRERNFAKSPPVDEGRQNPR